MNLTNYDDYDWHDEDYTGQPPDDGQSLIAGLEPDTDPDDDSVTVLEYGSSTDSDSFMSDEDMDECPDEYLDDCDNLDAVVLPYLTGSKPGKKKRKKKHKKKSKKKASASSKGVNLLKLAAFAKGDDEDDEDAECPVFDEFLDTITEGREELKERFMMALGYLLIEPSNGKYFFVMGYAPNSGKSILGNFIQKLYPENSVSNLSLGELGGKFETESLLYSRINISLDLPQEVLNASAVSKLKRITGGDSLEIQRKNQGSLKLDHNMKFLFATNFPLRIESSDPALFDRIIFLLFMRNTPKSIWTAKLRCNCGAGFIQFKWCVNRDGAVIHGFQCYRRTRKPSISYLQEHGLDLNISCQIKAISEWKLDLMAAKVFEHLTFDKGKTVKEVYKILSRCMAEEKTVRISRKAMLEKSIAKQRERLDKYIDLCADGIITKRELMERRKGLDNQIADLQSQYESVEQEDERSGALDMNRISQKLDEWQQASENEVNRELINSCVAQITPVTNEEFRWVLDFQLSELQGRNTAVYTMDGFIEMARFSISFEEAKAFKASRNQGIRKNEWHDLTVVVGIRSKIQR
ncbi:MAG: DUF5906 domain-containing protein [Faecalibacterium sp.]|nr:DUF5906 domain-containing protein [Faecalibacterium sp.]